MQVAILITLEYQHPPYEENHFIWTEIYEMMLKAGFSYTSRLFVINVDKADQAYNLARATIESMEEHLPFDERRLHRHIKDFYGFEFKDAVNLLLPCADNIEVDESLVSGE